METDCSSVGVRSMFLARDPSQLHSLVKELSLESAVGQRSPGWRDDSSSPVSAGLLRCFELVLFCSSTYKGKSDAGLALLIHPGQSPDLNLIESIWEIMKQRLRGRTWTGVAHFKADVEWRRITQARIRRRISEMPERCRQMVLTGGKRYRSRL
jgi:hypothetical protein